MFCIKCGQELPENGKFCPVCGTPVASKYEMTKNIESVHNSQNVLKQNDDKTFKNTGSNEQEKLDKDTILFFVKYRIIMNIAYFILLIVTAVIMYQFVTKYLPKMGIEDYLPGLEIGGIEGLVYDLGLGGIEGFVRGFEGDVSERLLHGLGVDGIIFLLICAGVCYVQEQVAGLMEEIGFQNLIFRRMKKKTRKTIRVVLMVLGYIIEICCVASLINNFYILHQHIGVGWFLVLAFVRPVQIGVIGWIFLQVSKIFTSNDNQIAL